MAVLKPGKNRLGIKATDEWTNRILGDRGLPSDKKMLPVVPDGPGGAGRGFTQSLPEAGLLGPVQVLAQDRH